MTITADQLTDWFRDFGALDRGRVRNVAAEPTSYVSTLSSMQRLRLTYASDAKGACPSTCLAKLSSAATFMLGALEADFYQQMHKQRYHHALPKIYAVQIDQAAQTTAVIMEEVQQTLAPTEWPIPPELNTCKRAVDALATFHSAWAGSTFAANTFKAQSDSGRFGSERLTSLAEALIDRLGDALSKPRQTRLMEIAARYPAEQALRFGEGGTLAHGDAHYWNFLFPKDTAQPAVMVDWQLWCADLGTADLAYMLALHWFPERRSRFERDLVRRYAEATDSSTEQTWENYRFSASGLIARTALYASVIPAAVWWPHLERAFNVFDDLNCAEFYS